VVLTKVARTSYGYVGPNPTLPLSVPFQSPGLPTTNKETRKSSRASGNDSDLCPQVHGPQHCETSFDFPPQDSGYDHRNEDIPSTSEGQFRSHDQVVSAGVNISSDKKLTYGQVNPGYNRFPAPTYRVERAYFDDEAARYVPDIMQTGSDLLRFPGPDAGMSHNSAASFTQQQPFAV